MLHNQNVDMKMTDNHKTICGRSAQKILNAIESFHGWKAPGIVLGAVMVDWAQELIGRDTESDAIVETRHCLPDAVQLFTPCTIGNGWLKILDWDKFALSLYDRKNSRGYRIWLDLGKTRRFSELYNWYMRLVPKKDLPMEVLNATILTAGRSVLSFRAIRLNRLHTRIKKGKIDICPQCKEAYPVKQGAKCAACQGEGYFDV